MDTLVFSHMILALGVVALAGLIHGGFGLGFPMVATPLLALLTDVQTAILLTLAPNIAVNFYSMLRGGGWSASLGRYWPVAMWMVLGTILGTLWLVSVDPNPFRLLLAATLVLYLVSDRFKERNLWGWMRGPERITNAGVGLTAGALAGTVNVSAPLLVAYFLELRLAPLILVQTINLCFLVGKSTQAVTFSVLGLLGPTLLLWSLPLAVMAMLGLLIGIAVRERVSVAVYRGWLRGFLWLMSGLLVVQFFMEAFG
ncbi:MAG: sulfite exporter TauE/SafE family protein, partial [Aquisalimonadaceae bacterium]